MSPRGTELLLLSQVGGKSHHQTRDSASGQNGSENNPSSPPAPTGNAHVRDLTPVGEEGVALSDKPGAWNSCFLILRR